jgi:hypothetical protein
MFPQKTSLGRPSDPLAGAAAGATFPRSSRPEQAASKDDKTTHRIVRMPPPSERRATIVQRAPHPVSDDAREGSIPDSPSHGLM